MCWWGSFYFRWATHTGAASFNDNNKKENLADDFRWPKAILEKLLGDDNGFVWIIIATHHSLPDCRPLGADRSLWCWGNHSDKIHLLLTHFINTRRVK